MATEDPASAEPGAQPAITDLECGEARFVCHHELDAIEVTVTDPAGVGFRTWVGRDFAATAALHFVGAVMRLLGESNAL
jgi:hypothetical protein